MRTFILFLVVSFIGQPYCIFAQEATSEPQPTVKVLARYTEDGVLLRWAPTTSDLWLECIRNGYKIERKSLDDDQFYVVREKVMPLSRSEWMTRGRTMDNDYFLTGLQCIHGEWESAGLGNSMGALIQRADELRNRYNFSLFAADLDSATATASGLRYLDANVEKNKVYEYLITPLTSPDFSTVVASGFAMVNTSEIHQNPRIAVDLSEEEGHVVLRWLRHEYDPYYTAYEVEASEDGRDYRSIDSIPFIHPLSNDSSTYTAWIVYRHPTPNDQPRYYRVRGVDPFGQWGPFSSPLRGMARDRTPPDAIENLKAHNVKENDIQLTWTLPQQNRADYFVVMRGHDVKDAFYPISPQLPPSTYSFTDEDAVEYDENFYMIYSFDTAGNYTSSLPIFGMIRDSIPPRTPTGLKGAIDSNGIVTLRWHSNPDEDIFGYKVFFANADFHEFSLLTGQAIVDTFFRDSLSLQTLTEEAYYRVMAVDYRHNYSPLSDILELKKPDTIRPNPPVFTDYYVDQGYVYIDWAPSGSRDVAKHVLMRKKFGGSWEELITVQDTVSSYRDQNVREADKYYYRILAIDDDGLVSNIARDVFLEVPALKTKKGVTATTAKYVDGHVMVSWEFKGVGSEKFVLYKSTPDGAFEIVKVVDGDKRRYEDRYVQKGDTYTYILQVRYENGLESDFGTPARITLTE